MVYRAGDFAPVRRDPARMAAASGGKRTMAPQIIVENLAKTFHIAQRAPGLWGAVRGLAKRTYREVRALDGISFTIAPGELVGYIGPNGAGKSTTVKTLAGILVPDGGKCEVNGRVPWLQ